MGVGNALLLSDPRCHERMPDQGTLLILQTKRNPIPSPMSPSYHLFTHYCVSLMCVYGFYAHLPSRRRQNRESNAQRCMAINFFQQINAFKMTVTLTRGEYLHVMSASFWLVGISECILLLYFIFDININQMWFWEIWNIWWQAFKEWKWKFVKRKYFSLFLLAILGLGNKRDLMREINRNAGKY